MDTQKITSDLIKSGLTQQQLADLVPCGQSTIAAYLAGTRGSRPSKFIGDRLEELHAQRCALAPESPPLRRATDAEPDPGRSGRTPPSRDNVMTATAGRAAVMEPKP